MAKPTQKLRPFTPRSTPVPSNPRMMNPDDDPVDERNEEQRFLAPSKRTLPELRMCKGGKVISSRRM